MSDFIKEYADIVLPICLWIIFIIGFIAGRLKD